MYIQLQSAGRQGTQRQVQTAGLLIDGNEVKQGGEFR